MNQKPRFKRRQYFLPGTSQPRLLIGAQVIFTAAGVITGLVLFLNANRDLTESYLSAHLAIKNVQQLLLPTLVVVNLIAFVLGGLAFVFFTHRIAGPVYRLCLIMKRIAEGDLTQKVVFRKNDYLGELAKSANAMQQALEERITAAQKEAAFIKTCVDQLQATPETLDQVGELSAALQRLNDHLGHFQTRSR